MSERRILPPHVSTVTDRGLWVQRTSPSTVVIRRGFRIVVSLIDDGEVARIAHELLATQPSEPSKGEW